MSNRVLIQIIFVMQKNGKDLRESQMELVNSDIWVMNILYLVTLQG